MGEKSQSKLTGEFEVEDDTDFSDTRVLHDELTRKLEMLARADKLDKQNEEGKTEDSDTLGETSAVRTYKFVKKRVGLKKLVLDRFKN